MSQSRSQLMCTPQEDCYTPDADQSRAADADQCIDPVASQPAGNQAACANLPSAQLNLSDLGAISVPIVVPGAVATATVRLGGQLTAKEKCSINPATVSNTGAAVQSGSSGAGAGPVSPRLSCPARWRA